jgi:hypothetical protein
MPNFKDFFGQLGGRRNGGNQRVLDVFESTPLPWTWTPKFKWVCRLLASELDRGDHDAALSQVTTITVSATNFVTGRATITFANRHAGGPLAAPVVVTADAVEGDANTDLAEAIADAIEAEALLDDIVAANDTSNVAFLTFTAGIGLVQVTVDYVEAQQTTVQFGGTIVDGPYRTFVDDVEVLTERVGGTPANAAALAVQHEADIEALIATTLAGVVQSADDDGTDLNTIVFEPDIDPVVVTTLPPRQTFTVTNAGTPADGRYSFRVNHTSLPNGYQPVFFDRAAAEDATGIADGLEASAEGNSALATILESADNAAGVNTLVFHEGVSGVTISDETAPGTGTLVSDETSPTMTVDDLAVTNATLTVANFLTIRLNTVKHPGGLADFPDHVVRCGAAIERVTGFGAGRNVYVGGIGDSGTDADGLVTSVSANTTGRVTGQAGAAQVRHRYESSFAPTATIELGSSVAMTAGDIEVQIDFKPAPGARVAA